MNTKTCVGAAFDSPESRSAVEGLMADSCSAQRLAGVFWPLNRLFGLGRVRPTSVLARALAILGVPPLLLFLASWVDGTLLLPSQDVGLLEHAGFLAFFVIHVAVVVLSSVKSPPKSTCVTISPHHPKTSSNRRVRVV